MNQPTNGLGRGVLPVAGDLPCTGDTITVGLPLHGEGTQTDVDPAERLFCDP